MYIFHSNTTVEFENKDVLEAFVKALPLDPKDHKRIMEGELFTDTEDQSSFPGAGKTVHAFVIDEE